MVLDIPESHGGRWNFGQLVQGLPPDHIGARLLNVAVSRAKHHLVVVANLTYLDKKLPGGSLLRSILYRMQENGSVVNAKRLLEFRPILEDLKGLHGRVPLEPVMDSFGIFDEHSFEPAIRADFLSARKSIVIYSGFITSQRIAQYGDLFREKILDGVKVRCVTRPAHRNGSIPYEFGKSALDQLEGIGCVVDLRQSVHQKAIVIDDEIVWHGSLNALSHAHGSEESMMRAVNGELARLLIADLARKRSFGESKSTQATEPENPRCPNGHRTVFCEGKRGPFYYCEKKYPSGECDWSTSVSKTGSHRQVDSHVAAKGEPCPKCGGPTVARNGQWGVFYGCAKYPTCKGIARKGRREDAGVGVKKSGGGRVSRGSRRSN